MDTCFSIGRRLDTDLIARIAGTTAERDSPEDAMLAAAQEARLTAARDAMADAAGAALTAGWPAGTTSRGTPFQRSTPAFRT